MEKYMKISATSILVLIVIFFHSIELKAEKFKLSDKELLGKKMFFDEKLSTPTGQSCATCHGQKAGWSGPDSEINLKWAVYPGAIHTRFGNRKPPTAAYAGMSPKLHRDEEGTFVGGMFWDGRATGWEINDPLAEQAMGPFLNPLEQNLPDKGTVVEKIRKSGYAELFEKVWGKGTLFLKDADKIYILIAKSIAAYERSSEVNPFNSKFDLFWYRACSKKLKVESIDESNFKEYSGLGLNDEELIGLMLFNTKGKCSECHVLSVENDKPPLFTDFTYDNLGVPKNPDNPFYSVDKKWNPNGKSWIDKGLGGFLEGVKKYKQFAKENFGKHKVPTLRNVDRKPMKNFVKAFMHNGFFKTLKDVVHFYNTRDVKDAKWPKPEIEVNVNTEELGDLGLSSKEEDAIVAFMKTLSDQ
jgi:cytochrome c peroxidase